MAVSPRGGAPGLDIRPTGGPGEVPVRLTLVGEIDLSTARALEESLRPLVTGSGTRVALDLSRVTFCDVVGLTRLLAARNALGARGGELILHGPCPSLQLLLDLLDPGLELAPPLTR